MLGSLVMWPASARLRIRLAGVALALVIGGCGGSGSSTSTAAKSQQATTTQTSGTTTASQTTGGSQTSKTAAWSSATQALCRQKRAAIARLGYIHITYAGIARVGLPAVKQSLDAYLGRLQGVLRAFSQRQQQLATPASAVSTMAEAHQVDAQTQAATNRLRTALASATNANALSAAFRSWLASLQQLAARGDAAARRLDLPDCESVPLTRAAAA